MKKYEKPVLTAISLSGNDQLCGSCAEKGVALKEDTDFALMMMEQFGFGIPSDGVQQEDFANVFGDEDQCKKPGMKVIKSYCKYQSTGTALVAWS